MVFKIGDNDYSAKVLMDTYEVNKIPIYTSWEDANGTTHRDVYRQKIQGQFDMEIAKLTEYQAFISDVAANMTRDNYLPVTLAVNNTNEVVAANIFLEYSPVQTRLNNYTKSYLSFTVTVEER